MEEKTNIMVPASLAEKMEKIAKGSGFDSLSTYVTFILRQFLSKLEAEQGNQKSYTEEEEKEVKERLKALGYL